MRIAIAGAARGDRAVLGPLRLEVGAGEAVAVLGPSGVGKTTLLRLIAGLDPAPPGAVRGAGRVAMVFQEPTLLPWRTVEENVAIAAGCGRARARDWLARVGIAERAGAHPWALSLGQQRRVALARAFAAEPETLLLDEPFVSLDPAAAAEMMGLLIELIDAAPARVILVSHARDEALALADRVIRLGGAPATVTGEMVLQRKRALRDAAWREAAARTLAAGG